MLKDSLKARLLALLCMLLIVICFSAYDSENLFTSDTPETLEPVGEALSVAPTSRSVTGKTLRLKLQSDADVERMLVQIVTLENGRWVSAVEPWLLDVSSGDTIMTSFTEQFDSFAVLSGSDCIVGLHPELGRTPAGEYGVSTLNWVSGETTGEDIPVVMEYWSDGGTGAQPEISDFYTPSDFPQCEAVFVLTFRFLTETCV